MTHPPRTIRVTEVLSYFQSPELVDWKVRVGKKGAGLVSRKAMKIGSRVDEIIKTQTMPRKGEKQEIQACYDAYYKWMRNYTPITVTPQKRAEKPIFGVVLSGEPDIMALDTLTDIKCSSRIDKKYWLQLGAYSWLTDWKGSIAILRLDKVTEAYQYEVREYLDYYWEIYKGLLAAYIYFTKEECDGRNDIV